MSAQRQCLPERELGKKMMAFNWQHWAGWGAGHGGIPVQDQGWYLVTFPFSSGSVFSTRPWLCFPAALERQEIKSQRLLLTYLHFHVSIHYLHFQGGNLGSFTGMGNFSAEFTDISACHAHRDVFPNYSSSSSCCSLGHRLSPPWLQRPLRMGLDGGAAPQPGFGVSSGIPWER